MRTLLFALAWAAIAVRIEAAQAAPSAPAQGDREASPSQERRAPSQEFRAFDDSIYALAYDVFLAAGNLKEAYSLASEAVRQVPGNEGWRERLAKTAEWSGNPRRAFEQWEHLCGHRRDDAPFREALRLAGTLRDHEASVRIWEGWARLRELEVPEWLVLMDEYEESGEPLRGIERLRGRIRTRPDSVLMDKLAGVLIRTGSDLEALETLRQLADRFGNSPAIALRRAEILCQRGNIREAGSILQRSESVNVQRSAGANVQRGESTNVQRGAGANANADTGTGQGLAFRRLQASILLIRQEYGEALAAYRKIFASGIYEMEDLRELVDLAKPRDSTLALRAAVEGWKRYAYPDFFVYYLERCIQVNRWDLASRAIANLSPDGWALFEEVPYYLSLSSRIHQHEGKDALARRELLDALRLDPASDDLRAGLLWLFIDQGRIDELEEYVALWDKGGESDDMLEPLAMAHKLLQHNRMALDYFRRLDGQGGRKDLLFLFSYADLLEQAGDGEGMRVIYARISALLKDGAAAGMDTDSPAWKEARARWSWKFGASGETARRMKALLADSAGGEAAQELVFSWKLERGENPEDALAQLGAQEARPGAAPDLPPWAELAVAVRRNDAEKVSDILEKRESSLSPVDRATAADFLGLRRRSLGYIRESFGSPLSPRQGPIGLGALIWGGANTAAGSFEFASHPLYLERKTTGSGRIALWEHTALGLALERRERPRLSPVVTMPVPEREDAARLEFSREGAHGSTQGGFGIRSVPEGSFKGRAGTGDVNVWTAGMSGEWRPLAEVSMELGFSLNHSAEENPVLSLGALKDEWKGGLGMDLPFRSRGNLAASRAEFHDRSGRHLGTGNLFRADWIHRPLRPLSLGLGTSYNGFRPGAAGQSGSGKPLIAGSLALNEFPQSFWQASAQFEWLDESPEARSAVPSPFLSGELERSFFPSLRERAGSEWVNAFALRAGFSLFPTRAQRLSLAASISQGVQLLAREETRVTTRYEYFFK